MSQRLFLKASSLIETVVAITIITLCSLVATLVYSSIIDRPPPGKKYRYTMELEQFMNESKDQSNLERQRKNFEGFTIERKVENYMSSEYLKHVQFIVLSGKDTTKFSMLVYTKNNK